MFKLNNVFKSDGIHQEQQVGNLRFDLTTGQMSTIIGSQGEIQTVIDQNGQTHMEQQVGNLRFNIGGSGGVDTLL